MRSKIVVEEGGLSEREDDFNKEFILNLLKKLDWQAFRSGAADVRFLEMLAMYRLVIRFQMFSLLI